MSARILVLALPISLIACDRPGRNTSHVEPGAARAGGTERSGDHNKDHSGCDDFASAFCARERECEPRSFESAFGTDAECSRQVSRTCQLRLFRPDSRWTPDRLRDCTASLLSLSCGEWRGRGLPFGSPTERCQVGGARAAGQGAWVWAECRSGQRREIVNSSCGICSDLSGIGGQCRRTGDCRGGLRCQLGKCMLLRERGEPCVRLPPWEGGDNCGFSLTCRGGICVPKGRAGDPCDSDADCDDEAYFDCNLLTRKCGQAVPSTAADAWKADGTVEFCRAGTASAQGDASAEVCASPLGLGAPCRVDGGQQVRCRGWAVCGGDRTCIVAEPHDCPAIPPLGEEPGPFDRHPWCTNPWYPKYCPPIDGAPPSCAPRWTDCSTVVECDRRPRGGVRALGFCSAGRAYDCLWRSCSACPMPRAENRCEQCRRRKCCYHWTACARRPECHGQKTGYSWFMLQGCLKEFCADECAG